MVASIASLATRSVTVTRGPKAVGALQPVPPVSALAGRSDEREVFQREAAVVSLSEQAVALARAFTPPPDEGTPGSGRAASGAAADEPEAPGSPAPDAAHAEASKRAALGDEDLSDSESEEVQQLKRRDREVRAHEQAHEAQGGAYAGSASFSYQTGPDGGRYAVGGEVPIQVAPVADDPEATIRKMQQVERAARAPADPSSADLRIASRAARYAQQARAQLVEQRSESLDEATGQRRPEEAVGQRPENATASPSAPTAETSSASSALELDQLATVGRAEPAVQSLQLQSPRRLDVRA